MGQVLKGGPQGVMGAQGTRMNLRLQWPWEEPFLPADLLLSLSPAPETRPPKPRSTYVRPPWMVPPLLIHTHVHTHIFTCEPYEQSGLKCTACF